VAPDAVGGGGAQLYVNGCDISDELLDHGLCHGTCGEERLQMAFSGNELLAQVHGLCPHVLKDGLRVSTLLLRELERFREIEDVPGGCRSLITTRRSPRRPHHGRSPRDSTSSLSLSSAPHPTGSVALRSPMFPPPRSQTGRSVSGVAYARGLVAVSPC